MAGARATGLRRGSIWQLPEGEGIDGEVPSPHLESFLQRHQDLRFPTSPNRSASLKRAFPLHLQPNIPTACTAVLQGSCPTSCCFENNKQLPSGRDREGDEKGLAEKLYCSNKQVLSPEHEPLSDQGLTNSSYFIRSSICLKMAFETGGCYPGFTEEEIEAPQP